MGFVFSPIVGATVPYSTLGAGFVVHPDDGPLFHEYESVVARPAVTSRCPLPPRERDEFLNAFLSTCSWVRISFRWRPNLEDESDNHIMELAVAGGASLIITNNVRDFRSGELVFPDIGIMTPGEFLKITRRRP